MSLLVSKRPSTQSSKHLKARPGPRVCNVLDKVFHDGFGSRRNRRKQKVSETGEKNDQRNSGGTLQQKETKKR